MKTSTRLALAATVILVFGSLYHGTTMVDGYDNTLEVEQAATALLYGLATVWLLKPILGPLIDKKAEPKKQIIEEMETDEE